MAYNYLFGPVHSRRFGRSLGIDLSPSTKSCNFDCLYCELEAKKPTSTIIDPPDVGEIIQEVERALHAFLDIDVITITANGEPTLYPALSQLIKQLNMIKKDKKLLILSNGSTIIDPTVRSVLMDIDIVKLSLDCATPRCFKKLDRPLKSIDLDAIIASMEHFNTSFKHELIIEILLVAGINDTEKELQALNAALQRIKPTRVDIGTIDRPPAYAVQGIDPERLHRLANHITHIPVSITKKPPIQENRIHLSKDELLALLHRRPQSIHDTKAYDDTTRAILHAQERSGTIIKRSVAGVEFYTIKGDNR
jgi:wyosine [tRNA(Phe)-imidazoG37] synthetase (radical SAM superfamily)